MIREVIFTGPPFAECHAPTLAETPAGLVAAWFAGTREGAPDVGIWLARRHSAAWTAPVQVAEGASLGGERQPCWNPVLHQEPDGPLLLFYKVGPSPQSWWGMVLRSADGGATWTDPEQLPGGVLGPIKNKPLRLPDGMLLCPSSTEGVAGGRPVWQCTVERTPDQGRTWDATPPLNDWTRIAAIQPGLFLWPDGRIQALCRTMQGRIATCWSQDEGRTWSPMELTELPNPNSGIDAVMLRDGAPSCATTRPYPARRVGRARTPLVLAVSEDGVRWRERGDAGGWTRRILLPGGNSGFRWLSHVAYTWRRQAIRCITLDPQALR
jgi:predicted neuraminidase